MKLLDEAELESFLTERIDRIREASYYLDDPQNDAIYDENFRDILKLIHGQKQAWADERLSALSSNVGQFPDDISNYSGELLGKWRERQRVQYLIDKERNKVNGAK